MYKKIFKSILVSFLLLLAYLIYSTPALAYYNDNMELLTLSGSGDYYYNYDFFGFDHVGDNEHVDHPASIVFGAYASKTAVKNGFDDDYPYSFPAGTMYNSLIDDGVWDDDSDNGRKTGLTDFDAYHYRLYAADGVSMYNSTWGNWVLATMHWDNWPAYGWSEYVEDDLCDIAENDNGWYVAEDEYYFFNYDNGYVTGVCTYLCDGYASYIIIPD